MKAIKAIKNKYKCKHCGKTVTRKSDKQWISSFCATTEQDVRLTLVK